jgi:non-homologous end joining protein Ku
VATDPKKQLSQEAPAIGLPVEELARELVTLIEDRVSQRSGEQLDDAFRDELTQAVTAKLEGWLKYD